jgi:hypothetical protein
MALVMAGIGCVVMACYTLGCLIFTGHVNVLLGLYVSIDTSFILGGGFGIIAVLLCYSDIYHYINQCSNRNPAGDPSDDTGINRIPVDDDEYSDIDVCDAEVLEELYSHEDFECAICLDSTLPKHIDSPKPKIITLRYKPINQNDHQKKDKPHDARSYHEDCILNSIAAGCHREPVLGVELFQPEREGRIVRCNKYNQYQKSLWKTAKEEIKEEIKKEEDNQEQKNKSFSTP